MRPSLALRHVSHAADRAERRWAPIHGKISREISSSTLAIYIPINADTHQLFRRRILIMDAKEHHHPLLPVLRHFVNKGALILAVWGCKRLIQWRRNRRHSGKGAVSESKMLSL
jgi:hypothetical protein